MSISDLYSPLGSAKREENGYSSLLFTSFRIRNAKAVQHTHDKALVVVTELRTEMLFPGLSCLVQPHGISWCECFITSGKTAVTSFPLSLLIV